MSISSMTTLAVAKRYDAADEGPRLAIGPNGAGGKSTKKSPTSSALDVLVTYIPSEAIILYVAVVDAIKTDEDGNEKTALFGYIAFWGFLLLTPIMTWLIFAVKCKELEKRVPISPKSWPKWELFAATAAFGLWALAIPDNPFKDESWYNQPLAGVMVLIGSILIGLIAPLFTPK